MRRAGLRRAAGHRQRGGSAVLTHGQATDAPAAEQRRRLQRGWYVYDWANSAFATTVLTVFLGPYLTDVAQEAAGPDGRVDVLGVAVRDGALYSYTIAASVVLAALLMPLVGAFADRTGRDRELLGAFATIGAGATMGMYALSGERYLLGVILLLVANIAFSLSGVVYTAYLPRITTPDERDAVSTTGWAAGYLGGLALLLVNLGLFLGHDSFGLTESEAVRISLASAGLWWGAFTLVPYLVLRGVPPRASLTVAHAGGTLAQLRETVSGLRQRPKLLAFLLAYLLYMEGIATVSSHASLYGDEELGLSETTLIGAIVVVQLVAFGGALAGGRAARRHGPKRVVLFGLVAWMVALGAAFTLPAGQAVPFYLLAVVIGLFLGVVPSLSRSMFAQMVPPGREAEYFALVALATKGTSAIGPLVFGLTYDLTGSYRASILVIVGFFVGGFVLLLRASISAAITEAGNPLPSRI